MRRPSPASPGGGGGKRPRGRPPLSAAQKRKQADCKDWWSPSAAKIAESGLPPAETDRKLRPARASAGKNLKRLIDMEDEDDEDFYEDGDKIVPVSKPYVPKAPVLLGPNGEVIKRKRGRPRKLRPEEIAASSAAMEAAVAAVAAVELPKQQQQEQQQHLPQPEQHHHHQQGIVPSPIIGPTTKLVVLDKRGEEEGEIGQSLEQHLPVPNRQQQSPKYTVVANFPGGKNGTEVNNISGVTEDHFFPFSMVDDEPDDSFNNVASVGELSSSSPAEGSSNAVDDEDFDTITTDKNGKLFFKLSAMSPSSSSPSPPSSTQQSSSKAGGVGDGVLMHKLEAGHRPVPGVMRKGELSVGEEEEGEIKSPNSSSPSSTLRCPTTTTTTKAAALMLDCNANNKGRNKVNSGNNGDNKVMEEEEEAPIEFPGKSPLRRRHQQQDGGGRKEESEKLEDLLSPSGTNTTNAIRGECEMRRQPPQSFPDRHPGEQEPEGDDEMRTRVEGKRCSDIENSSGSLQTTATTEETGRRKETTTNACGTISRLPGHQIRMEEGDKVAAAGPTPVPESNCISSQEGRVDVEEEEEEESGRRRGINVQTYTATPPKKEEGEEKERIDGSSILSAPPAAFGTTMAPAPINGSSRATSTGELLPRTSSMGKATVPSKNSIQKNWSERPPEVVVVEIRRKDPSASTNNEQLRGGTQDVPGAEAEEGRIERTPPPPAVGRKNGGNADDVVDATLTSHVEEERGSEMRQQREKEEDPSEKSEDADGNRCSSGGGVTRILTQSPSPPPSSPSTPGVPAVNAISSSPRRRSRLPLPQVPPPGDVDLFTQLHKSSRLSRNLSPGSCSLSSLGGSSRISGASKASSSRDSSPWEILDRLSGIVSNLKKKVAKNRMGTTKGDPKVVIKRLEDYETEQQQHHQILDVDRVTIAAAKASAADHNGMKKNKPLAATPAPALSKSLSSRMMLENEVLGDDEGDRDNDNKCDVGRGTRFQGEEEAGKKESRVEKRATQYSTSTTTKSTLPPVDGLHREKEQKQPTPKEKTDEKSLGGTTSERERRNKMGMEKEKKKEEGAEQQRQKSFCPAEEDGDKKLTPSSSASREDQMVKEVLKATITTAAAPRSGGSEEKIDGFPVVAVREGEEEEEVGSNFGEWGEKEEGIETTDEEEEEEGDYAVKGPSMGPAAAVNAPWPAVSGSPKIPNSSAAPTMMPLMDVEDLFVTDTEAMESIRVSPVKRPDLMVLPPLPPPPKPHSPQHQQHQDPFPPTSSDLTSSPKRKRKIPLPKSSSPPSGVHSLPGWSGIPVGKSSSAEKIKNKRHGSKRNNEEDDSCSVVSVSGFAHLGTRTAGSKTNRIRPRK